MDNSTRRSSAIPRLIRSKSGSMAAPPPSTSTLPETNPLTISKLKTSKTVQSTNPTKKTTQRKKPDEKTTTTATAEDGFVRFLNRSQSKIEVPRRTRSASTSPSAWALSPGRSSFSSPAPHVAVAPVPKSPALNYDKVTKKEARGGAVSGVLKYFRPTKKVSPVLEEEYHRFRVLYNRLLQWRFANARAESSMASVKKVAQRKLFNGWVRVSLIRNITVEKRMQVQKLKQDMKLYHILRSQMSLLNEWGRIEPKNVEAVGRVVRKLSAASLCLPLVDDAEADIMSVYDAISEAMEVMDNITAMILNMQWQVEQMCFLLTELSVLFKQQKQFFDELKKRIAVVASLEVHEISLRAHHILLENEVMMGVFA